MKNTISCTEYEHPKWDMRLILPNDGSRGTPKDFLGADEDAAQLKEVFYPEMTLDELDALPEWNG